FFDQERSRAERHGYQLVLMMMDLDGFKKVNDTYGHHVGDEILRRVAHVARVGLSIGYATYGQDGTAIDELMEVADQRMYEDKLARKRNASALRVAAF